MQAMQRCVFVALASVVASQHNDGDALSLLQTSVVKHNQSLLQVVSRTDEAGKKECKAAKQAFRELRATMKADRKAVRDAKAALKAAKIKRTETKDALKEARAAKEEACLKDPKDLPAPVNGGKIRDCIAHKSADFPRTKIDPVDEEGRKTYSEGRAGEMYEYPNYDPVPQPITGMQCPNYMKLQYNVEDAWHVPAEFRRDPESKSNWDCENCGCQLGCNGYIRGSADLGSVSSADKCLETALGTANCIGMKSITWINSIPGVSGKCYCTGGTMLVTTTGHDPNNLIDAQHASYKNGYSLTCMLPKKRSQTDHSTFTHNYPPKAVPMCTGGAPMGPLIQDHAEKSILLGNFGFDAKGRAACADQSWKEKKCQQFATRLSYSKDGECRCEWGPLLNPNNVWDWKLNGVTTQNENAILFGKWTTCLYPRFFLEKGTTAHAMWVR